MAMLPFPAHPRGVPWPTNEWPERLAPASVLHEAFTHAFSPAAKPEIGVTRALLVVREGAIIAERYADDLGPESLLPSWSMAKSVLHAIVGTLVADGRLDPRAPAPVPQWQGDGDPRSAITLDHLLRMSDGLAFREEYADGDNSDVLPMLFGAGKDDVAGFAASFPVAHAPGAVWSYSSGTSNIVSGIVARLFGGDPAAYGAYMRRVLFDRVGMRSADPRFDASGTWIGSSFVFCTARDFARFGLLYLRGGAWDGRRVLAEEWVDYARTVAPACATREYGAHWWIYPERPGVFWASGLQGQRIVVDPEHDVIVVRSAQSSAEQADAVRAFIFRVLDAAAGA